MKPEPDTRTLHERVKSLDISDLSQKSGIPRRTLERIRADADYHMAITTRLALEAALKRKTYRPAKVKHS